MIYTATQVVFSSVPGEGAEDPSARRAFHAGNGDTIEDGAQWTAPVMFSYKFLYNLYKPHEDMNTI